MDKNLDNQINNIKRLINYSRSKTLLEQSQNSDSKGNVEVGPISVTPLRKIEVNRYRSESEITGKDFDYPNYCGNPELAIPGDLNHPAYPNWCMYKTPVGVMYFPKESKVIRIVDTEQVYQDMFGGYLMDNNEELNKIFEKIGNTRGNQTEGKLRREFYDSLLKIIPLNSVRTISINGKNYGITLSGQWNQDTNVVNDDSSKKDLSIVWRFKNYAVKDQGYYYQPPSVEALSSGLDIAYQEGKNLANKGFESITAYLCGPNSPFAGKEFLGFYKSETLACDVLSLLFYLFGGPVSYVAGMSIEFINAKSLWDEGDRMGAVLCVIFALLPLIGEGTSSLLKNIVNKIGENGFTKVVSFISNLIKFLLGNLKAMDLWDMYKLLSKEERKIVLDITSKLSIITDQSNRYLVEVYNTVSKVDNIPGIDKDKLLKNLKYIIDEAELIRGIKNLGIQFGSILVLIFGVNFIKSAIDSYNETNNTSFNLEDLNTSKLPEEEIFSIIDQMAPNNQ